MWAYFVSCKSGCCLNKKRKHGPYFAEKKQNKNVYIGDIAAAIKENHTIREIIAAIERALINERMKGYNIKMKPTLSEIKRKHAKYDNDTL